MKRFHTVTISAVTVLAAVGMSTGVAKADTADTDGKVSYEKMIVLPLDFPAAGKVSVKVGPASTGAWQPVKATIVCTLACMYVNPPDNVSRIRVVNPKTKEVSLYLVFRSEPGNAPLAAVPLSDIIDETFPN